MANYPQRKFRGEILLNTALEQSLSTGLYMPFDRMPPWVPSYTFFGSSWTDVWYGEVVAKNTDSAARAVEFLNAAGTVRVTVSVPSGTTLFTRIRSSSTTYNDIDHIRLAQTTSAGQLQVLIARKIRISQSGTNAFVTVVHPGFNCFGKSSTGIQDTVWVDLPGQVYCDFVSANWDGPSYGAYWGSLQVAAYISSDKGSFWLGVQQDDGNYNFAGGTIWYGGPWTNTSYSGSGFGVGFTPLDGYHYKAIARTSNSKYPVYILGTLWQFNIGSGSITPPTTVGRFEERYNMIYPSAGATGLTDYDDYFDPTSAEWVAIALAYYHSHYGSQAASSTKLVKDPNGTPIDISGSTVTGARHQRSGDITANMPTSAILLAPNVVAL